MKFISTVWRWGHICAMVYMYKLEGNLQPTKLTFFNCVFQAVRLDNSCLPAESLNG